MVQRVYRVHSFRQRLCAARGRRARLVYAVTRLQAMWRGRVIRQEYLQLWHAVVSTQVSITCTPQLDTSFVSTCILLAHLYVMLCSDWYGWSCRPSGLAEPQRSSICSCHRNHDHADWSPKEASCWGSKYLLQSTRDASCQGSQYFLQKPTLISIVPCFAAVWYAAVNASSALQVFHLRVPLVVAGCGARLPCPPSCV